MLFIQVCKGIAVNCIPLTIFFQKADEFDLLMDEKIDFIQALQMAGTNQDDQVDFFEFSVYI